MPNRNAPLPGRSLDTVHKRVAFKAGAADFLAGRPFEDPRRLRDQFPYEFGRLVAAHLISKGRNVKGPSEISRLDVARAWLDNIYPHDTLSEQMAHDRRHRENARKYGPPPDL